MENLPFKSLRGKFVQPSKTEAESTYSASCSTSTDEKKLKHYFHKYHGATDAFGLGIR